MQRILAPDYSPGADEQNSDSWRASFRFGACIGTMNRDQAAAGALASWTAAVLCRFCALAPDSKAPEDWRTPKPGGAAFGSWKARRQNRSPIRSVRDPDEEDAGREFGAPFHGCGFKILGASGNVGGAFEDEGTAAHFGGGGRGGLAEEVADESAEGFIGGPVAGVIDVVFQLVEQFVRVRESIVDLPCQRVVQNVVEPFIDAWVEPAEIRQRQRHDAVAGFLRGRALENI